MRELVVWPDLSGYGRYDQLGEARGPGGDSYDYDEVVDDQPGFFDYDDPRDYEKWCDWNDVDVDEGYYDPFRPDMEGGFVSLRDGHIYCSCCFGYM